MKVYKIQFVHTDTLNDAFTRHFQSIHSAKEFIQDAYEFEGLSPIFQNGSPFTFVKPLNHTWQQIYAKGVRYLPFHIQSIHVEK